MTRRRRNRTSEVGANLDSLMDILTCSVGVMFIVVILAVTEARGTSVRVRLPLAQKPPANVERVLLLCRNGVVRPFRIDLWVDGAARIANERGVTYNNLPGVVDAMNEALLDDPYFTYRFEMRETERGYYERQRIAQIVVDEKAETEPGLTLQTLRDDPASVRSLLGDLDPARHWISFQVDAQSIAVFREARMAVADLGFASGWDPTSWSFPLRDTVLGGGPGGNGPRTGAEVQ